MENFDTQIIDLIGSFSDQSALDDFMTAGCKEIINSLPPQLLLKCADISTLDNSTTTLTNLDTDDYFNAVVQQLGRRPGIDSPMQYTAACNPDGPSHWVYKRFFYNILRHNCCIFSN